MSALVPSTSLPASLAASAPDSWLPSALGTDALDFSQILTDQLINQSSAQTTSGLLGLPFSGGLPGLSSGLGQVGSSDTMLESLMAISLVMIVERLLDTPSTTQAGPALANRTTASAGTAPAAIGSATSDPANPTNTADEPNTKWPITGRITQDFHPGHTGTDIAVPVGTPISTTLAGNVVFAGWNTQGYGKLVIVENGPYRTYYGHLSQIGVTVGDKVAAGSQLGLSGSTGNSTGPHLHYEVRINNTPVPPEYLP